MLDLTKLAGQLPEISQHLQREAKAAQQRLERAQILLDEIQGRQEEFTAQYEQWRDRLIFNAALPLEPIDTCITIPTPPAQHSVFATDGSQIAPSHHEIAYCYLINVGRVMLHYGQNLHPLLDSLPELFYKAEDLYIARQWGIRPEEWMGHRRTVSEAQMLADMAVRWVQPPGAHTDPNLALVDGSLTYWFLEALASEARDRLLPPILTAWDQLYQERIPLMGYLSAPRNSEAINFLRFPACPHPNPDCIRHCRGEESNGELEGGRWQNRLPCQVVDPLRDATLWAYVLQPGQRGALWRSSAPILNLYPEHLRVSFCYVHVGTEIARVEVPQWLAEDEDLFHQSLGILLAQVHKGYGYPVALAESHNQAVVRGGDRARFFALLEQQMIRAGLHNVGISYKETRKRGSIA
ncbi:DNA double-strand break repair nuclease NurA [Spirulina subsalsa FACHB-351]|uniref:DNA double-strand break repair nuclease NurA n=1 Tax=Spirulina subsalsa FACHB-351 TaxID=234711 RepID=A0ABT3L2R9_9CYAN|nr:DNA double-strand break repair nuclease NurA [Spirulina subsalsa]MCW6035804.1 DNA double-strand break repair nuclease NurA [Spirulina subsalsa FACHB-351]